MKIGFTGSRKGMKESQKQALIEFLTKNQFTEFHHGDAIGADSEAHKIVQEVSLQTKIIIHPANKDRAFSEGGFLIWDEKDPLIRNKDIVNFTEILLVFPSSNQEIQRSGTWATYRYALKMGKKVQLFLPGAK